MVEVPSYFEKRLQTDEEIVAFVRPFGIVYFWWFLLALLLILGAFYYLFLLLNSGTIGKIVFISVFLLGIFVLIKTLVVWRFTAVVITTKRIIDFDQQGIFSRTISEAPFSNIQDISLEQKGFWSVVLKFGTIKVQTAGTQNVLELQYVRYPRKLHDLLVELHQRYSQKEPAKDDEQGPISDPRLYKFLQILEQAKAEVGEEKVKQALDEWLNDKKIDKK